MPARRYVAPDGQAYHVGVRWFFDGEFHRDRPRGGRGARVRLFVPVAGGEWFRSYAIDPNAPAQVDADELARQFRAAEWVSRKPREQPVDDPR